MNSHTDTSPETERVLVQLHCQMPAWRKLQLLGQLKQMAKDLASCDLKTRYPNASETQLNWLLADRVLGPELALEVYGPLTGTIKERRTATASR